MYQSIISKLQQKAELSQNDIGFFISSSVSESLDDHQKGEVLMLLQKKGVTDEELMFFVNILSSQMSATLNFPNAVDICGTGGSGLTRINTSTISGFILAVLDIPVAKHGNKASSGRFGSFDMLELVGINIEVKPELLSYAFWKENLAFLFAKSFHPVMKHFGPVRQRLGFPTVFNILGPLLSPVQVQYQIIGTTFKDQMELMALTAKKLDKKKVLVVRGTDGLDEVTLMGKTQIVETHCNASLRKYEICPADFGVKPVTNFDEIAGGDPEFNVKITQDVLQGICKTRHLDLVLVNVAVVLKMMSDTGVLRRKVKSLEEAYRMARDTVESGKAWEKFQAYRDISNSKSKLFEITGNKYQVIQNAKYSFDKVQDLRQIPNSKNVETQNFVSSNQKKISKFKKALFKPGISLIAEVKKASPSKGSIQSDADFDPVKIAKFYEANGASAISVLTEERYFQGKLEYLKAVSEAVSIPVLRKDFIIDVSQIYEAKENGADAVLLIASILDKSQIEFFLKVAADIGLECLVEVHSKSEMKMVLETNSQIIGINNRDLNTLKIDLNQTNRIIDVVGAKNFQPLREVVIVSESGIQSAEDICALPRQVDAVLVGSSLMQIDEINKAQYIASLRRARKIFKACGIRKPEDVVFCVKNGVDMIGLNFVPASKRCISTDQALEIMSVVSLIRKMKIVGVFQDQTLEYVNQVAKLLNLGYIQLSGDEDLDYVRGCNSPVIKTIKLRSKEDIELARTFLPYCEYIIFDGKDPGSGGLLRYELLKNVDFSFLVAGGITVDNVFEICMSTGAIGVDVASGIEVNSVVSESRIDKFSQL